MKHTYYIALLLSLLLSACGGKEKDYVIGISQCMTDDDWRQAMIREVGIEASNYDNLKVIIKDADSNNDRQIEQIRELIRQKVDVLVISPLESAPLTAVAEEAYRAGIPTIITDRKVNTSQYTTFMPPATCRQMPQSSKYGVRKALPPHRSVTTVSGMPSRSART